MSLYVRDAGSWKEVTAGNGIHVRDAGSWKAVKEGFVRDAGTWKSFFVQSDPITVNFYPIWTASYQEGSPYAKAAYTYSDPANEVIQGDWDTIGVSGGMQRATGIIRFDRSAIIAALGGRTAVSSATLRLTVKTQYTSSGIYPSIYYADTDTPSTEPANQNGALIRGGTRVQGARTTVGNSTTTTVTALAQSIVDGNAYGFAVYHSGTTEPDKENYRGSFYGTEGTSAQDPYLSITADYA